ncbi:MAG: hypothetical protein C5B54_08955 [Acidobacteria bacterium]|nr:MAG: hypothetical protein C5B54_08955 [Acidobacteriota bacterium]
MRKILVLVVLGIGLTIAIAIAAVKQPMIGTAAPLYKIQSLDGKLVSLSDLRGKVVVLHFGAGW